MNDERFSELMFGQEEFITAIRAMFDLAYECRGKEAKKRRLTGLKPTYDTGVKVLQYDIQMDGIMIPFMHNGAVYLRKSRFFGLWHKEILVLRYGASYTWRAGGGGDTKLEPGTFLVDQDFVDAIPMLTLTLQDLVEDLRAELLNIEEYDKDYIEEITSLTLSTEDEA